MRYLILLLALTFVTAPVTAAGLRRTKVYIQNPTSGTINYLHKAGGDDWRKASLRSGGTWYFEGFDPHYVRFNNGRGRTVTYKLIAWSTNAWNWRNRALDLIKK